MSSATFVKGQLSKRRLQNVKTVPGLHYHLLSVSGTKCYGSTIVLEEGILRTMRGFRLLVEGRTQKKLYMLGTLASRSNKDSAMPFVTQHLDLRNACVAHVNLNGIR